MQPGEPAETLLIEGPDAAAFAHAQFSSNVTLLDVDQWQFSAWLDAQGRVRMLFHLARLDATRYLLLLRGGTATDMAAALSRFVFRAKLSITALGERHLATGPALPLHVVAVDGDTISLGCGTHAFNVTRAAAAEDQWRLLQLRAGWPWLPTAALNALLPAALSLQRLQAVAVDKGCYPGQEIVARLHFRGGHKRHLNSGTLSQPVAAGEWLRVDHRDVGCVLFVVTHDNRTEALLALNDEVARQGGANGTIAFDHPLTITLDTTWPA